MGFVEWVESGIRGVQHVKHQLDYHPKYERKQGFQGFVGGLKNLTQVIPDFAEGVMGGTEMSHDDKVDTSFQREAAEKQGISNTDYQRQPGAAAYHYVT